MVLQQQQQKQQQEQLLIDSENGVIVNKFWVDPTIVGERLRRAAPKQSWVSPKDL